MQKVYSEVAGKLNSLYQDAGFANVFARRYDLESTPVKATGIACGDAGKCLFALELYRATDDNEMGNDIRSYLQTLFEYVSSNKSQNYGFFNGRIGIAYLFLEFFKLTLEEEYLESAVHIVKEYWGKKVGFIRIFDKTGIADGLAGMIHFCLSLYDVVKKDWLLEPIGSCTNRLIEQADLIEEEIYWMRDTGEFDDSLIWPSGNSGIALCLVELGHYFNNYSLSELARKVLAIGVGSRRGTASGEKVERSIGQRLARLCADIGTEEYGQQGGRKNDCAFELLAENRPTSYDLYRGMAGFGLVNREAYRLTKDKRFIDLAVETANELSAMLDGKSQKPTDDLTLFSGLSGIGYSLLKIASPDGAPSLFLPLAHPGSSGKEDNFQLTIPMKVDYGNINQAILRRNFPDTHALLNNKFPGELARLLRIPGVIGTRAIRDWLNSMALGVPDGKVEESIREVAESEMTVLAFKSDHARAGNHSSIDYALRAERMRSLTDSQLLSLVVVVSDDIHILHKEATIDISKPVSPEQVSILLTSYGNRSYMVYINRFRQVGKCILGTARVYTDLLGSPAAVADLMERMISLLLSQPTEVMEKLFAAYNATDETNLQRLLSEDILHTPSVHF